jgi:hypothetical protein
VIRTRPLGRVACKHGQADYKPNSLAVWRFIAAVVLPSSERAGSLSPCYR